MKISEWFSDEIQEVREQGIIGIAWPNEEGMKAISETSRRLFELEALRDEALRLEALEDATVPADG